MNQKSTLILTAPPEYTARAVTAGLPVAHLAYRLGSGGQLLRAQLPVSLRGGLMALDCVGYQGGGDGDAFCQAVLRECAARRFDGVLCDFEGEAAPRCLPLLRPLARALAQRGWPLYVPEVLAQAGGRTRVLISSAISGGTLRQRLAEALELYGAERVALAAERTAEDFLLPARQGAGVPLAPGELEGLAARLHPARHFSPELCAHYFTYLDRQGRAHFVLYDDDESMAAKVRQARETGVRHLVLPYPGVASCLEAVRRG